MPKKRRRHKRKSRGKAEQNFEYRMEKLLRDAGFLTINCAMSRPFDIIAIKNNIGIPMELKQRRGNWSEDQQEFQKDLAWNSYNGFMFVQQLFKRNKRGYMIEITHYVDDLKGKYADTAMEIVGALKGSLLKMSVEKLSDE